MKKILTILAFVLLTCALVFSVTSCDLVSGLMGNESGTNNNDDTKLPDNNNNDTTPPESEHVHDYTASVVEPTCTEAGKKVYTCECGDSYEQAGAAAKGHEFDTDGNCKNCDEKVEPTTYTINFKNNSSWENVYVYMWYMVGEEAVLLTEAWPGAAMTNTESDWYSYNLEAAIGDPTAVKLIFNNGLTEGLQQTSDLIFSDTNLWWSNSVAYADKETAENAKSDSIIVYFRNTPGWTTPHAHAWNTSGAINSWPGVAMTKVEGTDDWYYYSIETASVDGLGYMFTDGVSDSNNKTADILYDATKLYYSNGNSYASMEEAESSTVVYSDWYLRGSNNGWGTGNRFEVDENGNSVITIELAKDVEFKLATAGWNPEINYNADAFTGNSNFTVGEGSNIKVAVAGTYTFTIDASGNLTITNN